MSVDIKNLTRDAQERIRDLAYLMWEAAGRQQNMALRYWLDAEREIFSSMQAATDAIIPARQQREKAKPAPDQPSAREYALEQPRNHADGDPGQAEVAADQPSRSDPTPSAPGARTAADAVKKALAKAAAGAAAERPAPRRTGGRKKTTK